MTHPSQDGPHRFSGHDPSAGRDTGGVPWEGRTLTGTGFDDDTGAADERDEQELVSAVAAARLIVPIVAVPSEVDTSSGIPIDAVSDMASVTLVAPDGQRALPAFTSTAALAAWNAEARPVPVTAQRAALAAVQEGCDVIPLDLPAPPGPAVCTLRPSMVYALAMGRAWAPAHRDPQVAAAVARAVAQEPAVLDHELGDGGEGQLQIRLRLQQQPRLTQAQVQALVTSVGQQLAADDDTRTRIDAVGFRLT